MDGEYLPYITTEVFCALFAATIFFRLRPEMGEKHEIRSLKNIILAYIVMLGTDTVWALTENGSISLEHYLNAAVNGISNTAVVLGCYYWFRYIEARLCPAARHSKKVEILTAAPAAAMCALNFISVFTGWTFYISPNGEYMLGKLFWLQGAITFAYLMVPTLHSLHMAIHTSSQNKRTEYITYIAYILVPSVLILVVDRFETVPFFALSIFMVIQVLFLNVYLEREHALAKSEREITESSIAVMLSQLQPHFLFNALMAIQEMCHVKSPDAEDAVVEFAEFLRGNLDSLRQHDRIPFENELNHTKNYLLLECKRFAGRINVEYDIKVKDFSLPALTLQPIVENAVRYGIAQKEEGGTVRISTEKGEGAYKITVTDDGVGFDIMSEKPDGRTHIGISTIQNRLETMCGGTLTVKSVSGKGTVAVVSIPQKR
jgi:two-component system LytT family sensor kinase